MKCIKCGTEFNGNFCPNCGEKCAEERCPACGNLRDDGERFCSQCGYRYQPNAEDGVPSQTGNSALPAADERKESKSATAENASDNLFSSEQQTQPAVQKKASAQKRIMPEPSPFAMAVNTNASTIAAIFCLLGILYSAFLQFPAFSIFASDRLLTVLALIGCAAIAACGILLATARARQLSQSIRYLRKRSKKPADPRYFFRMNFISCILFALIFFVTILLSDVIVAPSLQVWEMKEVSSIL